MSELVTTLPNERAMLAKLLRADKNQLFQERFYPDFMRQSGRRVSPNGLMTILLLGMQDYAASFPKDERHPIYWKILKCRTKFIKALAPNKAFAKATEREFTRELN